MFYTKKNTANSETDNIFRLMEKQGFFSKTHFLLENMVFPGKGKHKSLKLCLQIPVMVRSGGVTAQVIQGNITTENGVIHIVDRMLGFVYYSVREQLEEDSKEGLTR